jgi:FkbM family methyltransferase
VGGSETLAWHYAQLLSDAYEVDVLTTTAIDTSDWANVLPEGSEFKDGVRIVRFPVTIGRSRYWSGLHDRLVAEFGPFVPTRNDDVPQLSWTIALQEDLIRHQGPYSEPLLRYLNERWRDYRALIFITYLYPTTYFGLQQIPRHRALFAPTLHDELPAYLPAYKHSARCAHELVWLTAAEQRVGQKLWGELPGRVVSMAIDTRIREPQWMPTPYILYSGRVDPNKGCVDLFDYFITFKKIRPSNLRLVVTGKDDIPVPRHEDIDFRGFVSAEEKFRLMAGALLFANPSPNESFSIVTLEAMAQRTPVLANGASEVLADHIKDSGAGRVYVSYPTFAAALTEMLSDQVKLREIGAKGRAYVTAAYNRARIQKSLIESIEQIPESNTDLPEADEPSWIGGETWRTTPSIIIGDREQDVPMVVHQLGELFGHLLVRPLTFDAQIAEDVIVANEYALPEQFDSEDVVIDIGAHIGSFSYAALMRGAGKVYCYEAHPINHALATENLAKYADKTICRNMAVWRSDQEGQTLFNDSLNHQPNTGGISVLWNNEGLPVRTTSLDEVLLEASDHLEKTVRLLKLDCEGSEYPILYTATNLNVVEEICGEYHRLEPEQVPDRALVGTSRDQYNPDGLKKFLEERGFSVQLEPHSATVGIFHARNREPRTHSHINVREGSAGNTQSNL